MDGRITCGVFDIGGHRDAYTLSVAENGVELIAGDYSGIRYGFCTFIQILRIHRNVNTVRNSSTNFVFLELGFYYGFLFSHILIYSFLKHEKLGMYNTVHPETPSQDIESVVAVPGNCISLIYAIFQYLRISYKLL